MRHNRKYVCNSCKGEFYLKDIRLSRRCAPKCKLCGSYSIDIKTDESWSRLCEAQQITSAMQQERARKSGMCKD